MKKSVNKKRSQVGRRVIALAFALLLLVSVLVVPASAALADSFIPRDGQISLGGWDSATGFTNDYMQIATVNVNDLDSFSLASPYVMTYSNVQLNLNSKSEFSYISFELCYNGGHYSIGFYQNPYSGGPHVRAVDYTEYLYDEDYLPWDVLLNQDYLDSELYLSYSLYRIGDTVYILADVYVVCYGAVVQHQRAAFSFSASTSGKTDLTFALKCVDAAVWTETITPTVTLPHQIDDLLFIENYVSAKYNNAYSDGYKNGMDYGYAMGYGDGFSDNSDEVFQTIKELYLAAGGPNEYLRPEDVASVTEYFKDVGWTECANQGALTTKLIFTALEAPLNVILGGLDFTVFGINLAETIFAILSIVIIFAIVRVVLAILPLV